VGKKTRQGSLGEEEKVSSPENISVDRASGHSSRDMRMLDGSIEGKGVSKGGAERKDRDEKD